ncbi:hypothetical protein [Neobacillus sp.]|uniref:hypothetical protein n=1 Tax=Neobacillus sp. TaxID=2675273 RepID=UPI0035B50A41
MQKVHEFDFNSTLLDLKKQTIIDVITGQEIRIEPKISFPAAKFVFTDQIHTYKGISTKEKSNLLKKSFKIVDATENLTAKISELSVYQKKSVFKELDFIYKEKNYRVKTSLAYKNIELKDGDNIILEAERTSSTIKGIVGLKNYKVSIYNSLNMEFLLWVAVFKGIHLLIQE